MTYPPAELHATADPQTVTAASPTRDSSTTTPFEKRALPPSDVGRDYHQYKILKPLPDSVTEGKAAGWFDQPGGGTQYKFDKKIEWYIENDYLEEVK